MVTARKRTSIPGDREVVGDIAQGRLSEGAGGPVNVIFMDIFENVDMEGVMSVTAYEGVVVG